MARFVDVFLADPERDAERAAEAAGYDRGEAPRLLADRRVIAAITIDGERRATLDGAGVGTLTRDDLLRQLAADREVAHRVGTPAAAVAATVAQARLLGLIGAGNVAPPSTPRVRVRTFANGAPTGERDARAQVIGLEVDIDSGGDRAMIQGRPAVS